MRAMSRLQLFCHIPFDSDLQYNLREGWRHVFNGYCDHYNQKKLKKLAMLNQSVHVRNMFAKVLLSLVSIKPIMTTITTNFESNQSDYREG